MVDTFLTITYDLNEKKFLQLKEEFTAEMKDKFSCDDYEQIIDYILKCVFDNKQSKDRMINETRDMFKDKTEALYDFLWNTTEKIYQIPKGDLLDEIVKDKEKGKIQSKTLFNSAIKDVIKRKDSRSRSREKEENRIGERQYTRGGFNNVNNRGARVIRGGYGFPSRGGRGGRFTELPMRRGCFIRGNIRGTTNPYHNSSVRNEDKTTIDTTKLPDSSNINSITSNVVANDKPLNNEQDLSKQQNKKKIRCKNWPQCKDTNCEYSHPTETCTFFPTCVYGMKCMNIHPNIPCKFGYYCTRLGCNYSHPAGWNPALGGMCQMPYPKKHFKKPNHTDQE